MIGLCAVLFAAACGAPITQGPYGPYYRHSKHLVLGEAETLTVYRLKTWTFADASSPPAMQLEYEAPFSVTDTGEVRREALRVWPWFAPYVTANGLHIAIITATNLHSGAVPSGHYGLIAEDGPGNSWRFKDSGGALPPADTSTVPHIIDIDGKPMAFVAPAHAE